MDNREVVTVLYVLGALVTIAGVVTAYLQTVGQKRRFDDIAVLIGSDDEPDLVDIYEKAKAGETADLAAQAATRSAREAELEKALLAVGIQDPSPTWNDMRLPVAYWSKRNALGGHARNIQDGRTGGPFWAGAHYDREHLEPLSVIARAISASSPRGSGPTGARRSRGRTRR
ncbi:hypothetical protein V6K52_12575 [Knoellia sp. S7-12]|uniref:hypothetical protein n=1 Tax=Knoellia sp. S7-12 TaxID=3126698 RepID=UPI00336651AE